MKYLSIVGLFLLLLSKSLAQDCHCALSLSATAPQSPDCSFGSISAAGETCHWNSYSVEFEIRNLETGEILSGPHFGGVGGSNALNLTGNVSHWIMNLPNGRWQIHAKIVEGSCAGREATITADLRKIERCDGLDNDCTGGTDNGLARHKYFKDGDNDGYGNTAHYIVRCGPSGDYTARDSNDCNDNNPQINPGTLEICGDGIDNNCDGLIDENKRVFYLDKDNDGYGSSENTPCRPKNVARVDVDRRPRFLVVCERPAGYSESSRDCDDCNSKINPGQREICDKIDNNCNGLNNETLSKKWFPDKDKDRYGDAKVRGIVIACDRKPPVGYVQNNDDFDDDCKTCYPGSREICGDGNDNDGKSYTPDVVTAYFDRDNDGHYSTILTTGCGKHQKRQGDDCDDFNHSIYPGAGQSCKDNDCNGIVDEYESDGNLVVYQNLFFERRPEGELEYELNSIAFSDEPFYYSATIESKQENLLCVDNIHLEQWNGIEWKEVQGGTINISETRFYCKSCLDFNDINEMAYRQFVKRYALLGKKIFPFRKNIFAITKNSSSNQNLRNIQPFADEDNGIELNIPCGPLDTKFFTATITIDSFFLDENITSVRLCYTNCRILMPQPQPIQTRSVIRYDTSTRYQFSQPANSMFNPGEAHCLSEINVRVRKAPPFLILISKGGFCQEDVIDGGSPCTANAIGCSSSGIDPTIDPIFLDLINCNCNDICGTGCLTFTESYGKSLSELRLIKTFTRMGKDVVCNTTNHEGINNTLITGKFSNTDIPCTWPLQNDCRGLLTFEAQIDNWRNQGGRYVIMVGHSHGASKFIHIVRDTWRWGTDIEVPLFVSLDATSDDDPPLITSNAPVANCNENYSRSPRWVGQVPEFVLNFYQTNSSLDFQNGGSLMDANQEYNLSCCFSHTAITRSLFVHDKVIHTIFEVVKEKRNEERLTQ